MIRNMPHRNSFLLAIPLAFVAGYFVPQLGAQISVWHGLPGDPDFYSCELSGLRGMGKDCGTNYEEMVFTAEILALDPAPDDEFRLTLRPLTVFKGTPGIGVQAFTSQHRCLPEMKTGDHWLFSLYRDRDTKNLIVNYGSRSGPAEEEAEQIAFLGKLAGLDKAGIVKGRAYFYEETGEHSREERPSSNQAILLTHVDDGRKLKAMTDSNGDFEFEPLPAGKYELEPNTKPGLWTMWSGDFDLEAHGCTAFDLDFQIDGQISGRLVFPAGVDPSTWEVEATPADDPGVVPASTWTDDTGRFVLHGLKAGKYIVVFEKTDKREEVNLQVDLFAPGTSNRSNARVIELGKATRVDDVEIVVPRTALK
jgi:hypothetical protein